MTSGLPIPSIDPDTEVVVAFVADVACTTFLAGLDGDAGGGGVLVPRLADVPGQACRLALQPRTFVLAVERASVPNGFILELAADARFPTTRSLPVEVAPPPG